MKTTLKSIIIIFIILFSLSLLTSISYADSAMQYFSEGNSLFEAGKIEEAIQSYNKAIELNPNLAEIHYNKGVALFNLKKYNEAIESYNRSIERKLI